MSFAESDDIFIDHLEFYVPENSIPLSEVLKGQAHDFSLAGMEEIWKEIMIEPEALYASFANQLSKSVNGFRSVEGFNPEAFGERVFCAGSETSSDMALEVGRKILSLEPALAEEVDCAIYCHATLNEAPMWSTPCRLQSELGLKNAFAFSIGDKGSNASLMSLRVACDMLAAEPKLQTILLIGSEKCVQPYQRTFGQMTVMGDSASAMILRRRGKSCRILHISICDFPEWWSEYDKDFEIRLIDKAASHLNQTLEELALEWDDVALLIAPNLNVHFNRSLAERLAIPEKRIYSRNISRYGHLATSDLVVNLASAAREGVIRSNDLVLILGLGLNSSVGCAAIRF